jgi:hypothetical protein
VSEATKSKQLNHYILVFTILTIFYLPLSFITVSLAGCLYLNPYSLTHVEHKSLSPTNGPESGIIRTRPFQLGRSQPEDVLHYHSRFSGRRHVLLCRIAHLVHPKTQTEASEEENRAGRPIVGPSSLVAITGKGAEIMGRVSTQKIAPNV